MAASLLRMARSAEARTTVVRAAQIARELGRWDLVTKAATILNQAGVWSWHQYGQRDEPFIALLTEASEQVPDKDRARLLSTLQMELYYSWDGADADRVGNEAVDLVRAIGDPDLLLEVPAGADHLHLAPGQG